MSDELRQLREELDKLRIDYKKQSRQLEKANLLIEQNRIATMAKDNLGRIISSAKSELERYMNLLLENSPDIIMLFDQDGHIAYCTEVFLRFIHIPAFGMIKGKHYREFLKPLATPAFIDRMDSVFNLVHNQKQTVEFDEDIDFDGNGIYRSYSIQVAPMLDVGGMHAGSIAFFHDTTDILRAKQEAERANHSKSDFLATISHEIRTPMNAIIGLSDMMKSAGLGDDQLKRLDGIQRSSHVLLNLINDILDFSKIDAGKLELIEEYFNFSHLLMYLKSMFETMFAQKGLDFNCIFDPALPEVVFGDDKRIGQIITNILNNALKYTESGAVTFRALGVEGGIRFEIEDTGIGIREDAMPRLFTAFEQLDLVRNKKVVGTGLGLAITSKLCAMMDGTIEVESEYGKGSIFRIYLPLTTGTASDLPDTGSSSGAIDFEAPGARILIVDDIEINLQIAAFMLEPFAVYTDTASNGREAIEKVKANYYDLILMDHMMPEMDGVEATKIIRSLEGKAALTPIVALTANAVNDAKAMFMSNGFDGFLSKPMEHAALSEALFKWLPESLIIKK